MKDFIIGCSDNFVYASYQMFNNPQILLAVLVCALTIGPFNFFGSGITKISSASHRCTIDSLRMISVWGISIACGWESFRANQLWGYGVLTLGTLIYNEVISIRAEDYTLKPALPSSLSVKENFRILTAQFRNFMNFITPAKNSKEGKFRGFDGESKEGDLLEHKRILRGDEESNDERDVSKSLTLEDILDSFYDGSSIDGSKNMGIAKE